MAEPQVSKICWGLTDGGGWASAKEDMSSQSSSVCVTAIVPEGMLGYQITAPFLI
ncbi:hypothetical protein Z945_1648 [Sulfitobacter noctilucae]|nr:hypothetical protein Z945_1648 [Sulfitobacter noctilucae]